MNRYKITKQLGDGTYGSVLKAVNRQTGEVVSATTLPSLPPSPPPAPDGCEENEEEVLHMGGVHAAPGGEGELPLLSPFPHFFPLPRSALRV